MTKKILSLKLVIFCSFVALLFFKPIMADENSSEQVQKKISSAFDKLVDDQTEITSPDPEKPTSPRFILGRLIDYYKLRKKLDQKQLEEVAKWEKEGKGTVLKKTLNPIHLASLCLQKLENEAEWKEINNKTTALLNVLPKDGTEDYIEFRKKVEHYQNISACENSLNGLKDLSTGKKINEALELYGKNTSCRNAEKMRQIVLDLGLKEVKKNMDEKKETSAEKLLKQLSPLASKTANKTYQKQFQNIELELRRNKKDRKLLKDAKYAERLVNKSDFEAAMALALEFLGENLENYPSAQKKRRHVIDKILLRSAEEICERKFGKKDAEAAEIINKVHPYAESKSQQERIQRLRKKLDFFKALSSFKTKQTDSKAQKLQKFLNNELITKNTRASAALLLAEFYYNNKKTPDSVDKFQESVKYYHKAFSLGASKTSGRLNKIAEMNYWIAKHYLNGGRKKEAFDHMTKNQIHRHYNTSEFHNDRAELALDFYHSDIAADSFKWLLDNKEMKKNEKNILKKNYLNCLVNLCRFQEAQEITLGFLEKDFDNESLWVDYLSLSALPIYREMMDLVFLLRKAGKEKDINLLNTLKKGFTEISLYTNFNVDVELDDIRNEQVFTDKDGTENIIQYYMDLAGSIPDSLLENGYALLDPNGNVLIMLRDGTLQVLALSNRIKNDFKPDIEEIKVMYKNKEDYRTLLDTLVKNVYIDAYVDYAKISSENIGYNLFSTENYFGVPPKSKKEFLKKLIDILQKTALGSVAVSDNESSSLPSVAYYIIALKLAKQPSISVSSDTAPHKEEFLTQGKFSSNIDNQYMSDTLLYAKANRMNYLFLEERESKRFVFKEITAPIRNSNRETQGVFRIGVLLKDLPEKEPEDSAKANNTLKRTPEE